MEAENRRKRRRKMAFMVCSILNGGVLSFAGEEIELVARFDFSTDKTNQANHRNRDHH